LLATFLTALRAASRARRRRKAGTGKFLAAATDKTASRAAGFTLASGDCFGRRSRRLTAAALPLSLPTLSLPDDGPSWLCANAAPDGNAKPKASKQANRPIILMPILRPWV
jgi:hypothetical protein